MEEKVSTAQQVVHSAANLSPAQRVHHDALHSIFSWLKIHELNNTAQTCRWFLAAASTCASSLGENLCLSLELVQSSLLTSCLKHHLTSLHIHGSLSLTELRSLRSLDRLEKLNVTVDINAVRRTPHLPISLPPRIMLLELSVLAGDNSRRYPSDSVVRGVQQLLIRAVAACIKCEYLTLNMSGRNVEVDYSPLLSLTSLARLDIDATMNGVAMTKQLLRLSELALHTPSNSAVVSISQRSGLLRQLCSSPPPSKLDTLFLRSSWRLRAQDIPHLALLPALTFIDAEFVESCAALLPSLHLHTLDFDSSDQPCGAFLHVIPQLSDLRDLRLYKCTLSDEQGLTIINSLPNLDCLVMTFVRMNSLEWMRNANLSSLTFRHCTGLVADDLVPLLSLKRLDYLCIHSTVWLQHLAERGVKALIPTLQDFHYDPPNDDSDSDADDESDSDVIDDSDDTDNSDVERVW